MSDTDSALDARLRADPKWAALNTELDGARAELREIEAQLVADRETAARPRPPQQMQRPGSWNPLDRIPNPDYEKWRAARANVAKYDDPLLGDEAAQKALEALRKRVSDLAVSLGTQASAVRNTRPAQAEPEIRLIEGVYRERDPRTGVWRPVTVEGEGGVPRAAVAGTATGPHTIQKTEKGPPDENGYQPTYLVTYDVDAQGNETWNGETPKRLDLGPSVASPRSQVDLQTAQVNLQAAQQKLAEATSPGAQEKARIDLEVARTNLAQAQRKAAAELLPETISAPSTQRVIVQRDPTTGELTAVPNPAYQAPGPEPVSAPGSQPLLAFRDPRTGAITTQPNPNYRAALPQNAYAAYAQERSRVQAEGRRRIDELQRQQEQGLLSAADAGRQFDQWLAGETAGLTGLETAAREAQRQEQIALEQQQRLEQQRVEGLERTRQQLGYEAGEAARRDLAAVLPQGRTPQFLREYGGLVSNMAARANAPSAEAAAALPRAPTITPDVFNPANFKAALPDLDAYARQATARALSAISPIAAATINRPMPRFPEPPDLPALLAQVPYRGPLQAPPPGVQPLPGQEAIDLRTGFARSQYPGGSFLDWRLPA
jgi:hypothetical protein